MILPRDGRDGARPESNRRQFRTTLAIRRARGTTSGPELDRLLRAWTQGGCPCFPLASAAPSPRP